MTVIPSIYEVRLGIIVICDFLDSEIAVAEVGITQPEAEFEARGDIFLSVGGKLSYMQASKLVRFAYSIEVTVVNLKAIKLRL
jgi:hypothetical protein